MPAIASDFRNARRALLRSPGFAVAAVVTLALGIGAATTLFAVVYGVLLRPLPYPQPGRLVALIERHVTTGEEGSLSAPDFRDVRSAARSFATLALWRPRSFELSGDGRPERVRGIETSAGYLEVLGYQPTLGRFHTREDEHGGSGVVIGEGLWKRALGGDPGVIGHTLTLDGRALTVIGVMPSDPPLPGGLRADVVSALDWHVSPARDRVDHTYRGVGALEPGVTLTASVAELRTLSASLAARHPTEVRRDWPIIARDLRDYLLGDRTRPVLLLMGSVSLLLLVACANVANLFLARSVGRSRDIAIRVAFGAGVRGLLGGFLAEGVSIGLAGGLLGLILAAVATRFVGVWLPGASGLTGITRVGPDAAVGAFALALALATGTCFALVPLVQTRKLELVAELNQGGRSGSPGRGSLRNLLVAGEVALSTVLLMASGLFLRSLAKVMGAEPGFDVRGVVTFHLELPPNRYGSEERLRSFQDDLLRRLQGVPGVEDVGTTCEAPLTGAEDDTSFAVGELARAVPPSGWPSAERDQVGGRYFETMGIPVLRGRSLTEHDGVGSPRVVVVSESLARRYVKGDPIGQRLVHGQQSNVSPAGTSFEIVGVARDIRNSAKEKAPAPRIYMPFAQVPRSYLNAVLRTSRPPADLQPLIETVVGAIDPRLPIGRVCSLEERAWTDTSDRRQTTMLLGAFTLVALLLSAVGIYGVVSYVAAQSRREFGIRVAVGAQPGQIVKLVLRRGLVPSALGCAVGLIANVGISALISSNLYGVTALDPVCVAGSTLVVLLTSLLASGAPAVRAARMPPLLALRTE